MKVETATSAIFYIGLGSVLSGISNLIVLFLLISSSLATIFTIFIINTLVTLVLGSVFYAVKTFAEKQAERQQNLSSTQMSDEKEFVEF